MKQILMDFSSTMTKTVLVEDGKLVEVLVDKKDAISSVGNIYAGIVKNILPSQFAFVDIGLEKNAFLHLSDHKEQQLYADKKLLLKTGQTILVQVIKDSTGSKGAALTTELSLSSPNMVVYLANECEIGISKKIANDKERGRLKQIAKSVLQHEQMGVILRTSCEGLSEENLSEELTQNMEQFKKMILFGNHVKAPAAVYKESNELEKTLELILHDDIGQIVINDSSQVAPIQLILEKRNMNIPIEVYQDSIPLFSSYFVQSQIDKALHQKIWLPSGGFLVIEETEACVVIDVNTGKFEGNKNQQKTVTKTNMEAATEIAKQLRLRNLSGMIIVDFIDMKEHSDKEKLMQVLKEAVQKDRLAVSILGMVHLGVVMMTRKKAREPISRLLLQKCPVCHGKGVVQEK